jgi:hypothetical protein
VAATCTTHRAGSFDQSDVNHSAYVIEDHGPCPVPWVSGQSGISEVVDMTKSLVVKLFWGSLIGLVAGLILMGITFALAINNDIFIMSGPDVTGIKSGVLPWILVGLCALAMLLLLFAAVVHFVAWIGAVLNTAQLPDKTWFVVLLVVGLLGLVFIATVAYVTAGPDGVKAKEEASALPQAGPVSPQVRPSTISGPNQHVG